MAVVPLEPRTFTTLQMILPRDKFRSRLITTFADFVCDEIARIAKEEEGGEVSPLAYTRKRNFGPGKSPRHSSG